MYIYMYIYIYTEREREIMVFIGKPRGRSIMISNHELLDLHRYLRERKG